MTLPGSPGGARGRSHGHGAIGLIRLGMTPGMVGQVIPGIPDIGIPGTGIHGIGTPGIGIHGMVIPIITTIGMTFIGDSPDSLPTADISMAPGS